MSTEQERRVRAAHDAAAWWLRVESAAMSVRERAEFVDWLRESPLHVAEMLRLARLHRSLSRFSRWDEVASELLADAEGASNIIPLACDIPQAPKSNAVRFRRFSLAAVAASVVIAGCLVFFGTRGGIETQVGEKRAITLDEGSEVTLAPNTRIRVRLDNDRRLVLLLKGQAFFHVHSDLHRPFWVEAGPARTRAIGTSFSVERHSDTVIVTVVEGRVAVNQLRGTDVSVNANEQVALTENGSAAPVHKVDGKVETAWLQGELIFDNDSVADVVHRFNAYNRTQIHVLDAALARRSVTAVFQATDPDSFVAFLQSVGGVRVQRKGDNEILIATSSATVQPRAAHE
jgi:transmembrane sensor